MPFARVTSQDRSGKGNVGKPDAPAVTALEMQQILDELPNLALDRLNALMDQLEAPEAAAWLGAPGGSIQGQLEGVRAVQSAHNARLDNPHAVTKGQLGLGLVDNTSDENKPLSRAQREAVSSLSARIQSVLLEASLTKALAQGAVSRAEQAKQTAGLAEEKAALAKEKAREALTAANRATKRAEQAFTAAEQAALVYDPVTGLKTTAQQAISQLWEQMKPAPLTAGGYQALALTAQAYQAKGLTAYDFATRGAALLGGNT